MIAWELPVSLNVGGHFWKIRADFRAILDILTAFSDPDMEIDEKWYVCLYILYEDFEQMPESLYEEASKKAVEFIDAGVPKDNDRNKPTLMNWEQDAPIIIPAVNKVLGYECRSKDFVHWWTFTGAYMEIGDSLFSNVIGIRQKTSSGKKLETYEKEFVRNNKHLVTLQKKLTEEEAEEEKKRQDAVKALLGV